MNPRPRISIVLPVYNGSRFLGEAIESCVRQSCADWELIVVDDASDDATPRIIREWSERDPRIRSVRNEKNLKLPGSLNAGFSEARGDYLTWTSDDNRYLPEALEEMGRILDSYPPVDIVYCEYDKINEEGAVIGRHWIEDPEAMIRGNCIGACFLYRRKVHEKLEGYDETLCLSEDKDFWLRAREAGFQYYPYRRTLYQYRFHEKSLTSTRTEEIRRISRLAHHRAVPRQYRAEKKRMAEALLKYSEQFWGMGRRVLLFESLLKIVCLCPRMLMDKAFLKWAAYSVLSRRVVEAIKRRMSGRRPNSPS